MFISIALLLLLLLGLGFWIVKESRTPTWLKVASVTVAFSFCVILTTSLNSSLGWAVSGYENLPKTVAIRHVIVSEPNKDLNYAGCIYLLLDTPPTKYDSLVLKMFGHHSEKTEPRLYRIPYTRSLHESLAKDVFPKLLKGQVVRGRIGKKGQGNGEGEGFDGDGQGGNGRGRGGRGGRGNGRGGGSDSLEQNDPMFYELPPSYFQEKH